MLLSYTVFSIVRFIPSLLLQVQMSAVQFDHRTIPSDHLILAVKRGKSEGTTSQSKTTDGKQTTHFVTPATAVSLRGFLDSSPYHISPRLNLLDYQTSNPQSDDGLVVVNFAQTYLA